MQISFLNEKKINVNMWISEMKSFNQELIYVFAKTSILTILYLRIIGVSGPSVCKINIKLNAMMGKV